MLTKESIEKDIIQVIGIKSRRDAAAQELARKNLKIEKSGAYFVVSLYDSTVKIHVNTKYVGAKAYHLLLNNQLWREAKAIVKQSFQEVK